MGRRMVLFVCQHGAGLDAAEFDETMRDELRQRVSDLTTTL